MFNSNPKLYIDSSAIKHNLKQIKNHVGNNVKIMAVLKANAYGNGLKDILNIFSEYDYVAVADVTEAVELKKIDSSKHVVVLYQPIIEEIDMIINNNITVAICDINFAIKLNEASQENNTITKVHIEIDTLMSRLGVLPSEVKNFANIIKELKNIEVEGIFTHYSSAKYLVKEDMDFTDKQTKLFDKAINDIEGILGKVKYVHSSSGAAIFNPAAKHYTMVRPGYVLYGYYSDENLKEIVNLKPALKLSAKIIRIAEYDANTPIGYNRQFITKRKSKIAVIAMGYSDGLSRVMYKKDRKINGSVIINGAKAPIVGTICMDVCMIDITDVPGVVNVADEVFIWDNNIITLEEVATICDTIGYEVMTRLNKSIMKVID